MIEILIPEGFTKEREYIVSVIFEEYLGLEYTLEIGGQRDYQVTLPNQKKIIVESHFFDKSNVTYLDSNFLPTDIKFGNYNHSFKNVPILYGNDKVVQSRDQIILGLDLFSSSFFMLTRWEEYVSDVRDNQNRFPLYESIAFKNEFLNRPIVNEYLEIFWGYIIQLDQTLVRKKREFNFVLSHDVDVLKYINRPVPFLFSACKTLIQNPSSGLFKLRKLYESKFTSKKDIFDTYDYFMDLSEGIGVKSHFFFIAGGVSPKDKAYSIHDTYAKDIIKNINDRNHIIGIHPSYMSYNDPKQFSLEVNTLQELSPQPVEYGRQHYLRFEVPTTWQIWEDNNLKWDSTLSYAAHQGFRCGTCYEYRVFNVLTRSKLKLREKPLLVMDGSLVTYQSLEENEMIGKINEVLDEVKKYNGDFTFLWHNSSFGNERWRKFDYVYESILKPYNVSK